MPEHYALEVSKFKDLLNRMDGGKTITPNFISMLPPPSVEAQQQTADAFSDKWNQYKYGSPEFNTILDQQKKWYLELYGFVDESALAAYLRQCRVVLDAGAGMCYKSAWFAELSPSTVVVAADISNSLYQAVEYYTSLNNLFFIQCDIGSMPFIPNGFFDYVSCDQVIHHTSDPYKTFKELVRITGFQRELSVYVYRRKALPRELLDDYFRDFSKTLSNEQRLEFSRQITELGQTLSSLDAELQFPDIPALGIEGGTMTVQRFIYWNFIKCYWNEDLGQHNSVMTNYDWYSPSLAYRYSEQEFRRWIDEMKLDVIHFHKEQACYSGRFVKSENI
jgi:ubiquinone/menaquinone biosynthesis C-methylase UbiE